ncbi:tetratricopeptide repeat protein [Stutzerimonas stutzeri]|uniref:tetratricopeptide repeat protein n=1 Tax=Stutzerimonas stutzeri TaxID=316 RepID=UPI0015E3406C|nr:hypothetical protein [Stutzerimonas stutzeri]MBA1225315.1 hypothetical protein [Stutzerimonas stutzeri]
MKSIYQHQLELASAIENNSEKLTFLTAVLRSVLQLAVISTFEIAKKLTPHDESDMAELAERFCKPADGMPLQIIDNLAPFLRAYVDKTLYPGWFETTKVVPTPLSRQLVEWVAFRNKHPGHGVVDIPTAEVWAKKTESLVNTCLHVFSSIIPSISESGEIRLTKISGEPLLSTPVIFKDQAIVVTGIAAKHGIWKLRGQLLSNANSEEFTATLPDDNVFSLRNIKSAGAYDLSYIVSNNKDHSFYHNIPVRQTDTFEGRESELELLREWFDDKGSRYCGVYGDGGYGKTTLVLEFLNKILESEYDLEEPIPTIISYHTAKMTKWSEAGIIHFTGISPVMDECLRDLVRCLIPVLPAEWYSVSGRQLIDKTVGELNKHKLTKDDILLIIDNTETLATSPQEVKDLGVFFKQVGKLVGRMIITSRRREFLPADPVMIEGLSEIECVNLMRRLASEHKATAITKAGEAKLRRVSNQLMRKPILLEALVKYISHSAIGIDSAIDNVFKKSNEDLIEFLYEDAWLRINELQKQVFLVLIHVTSPLDKVTISKACQEIGIQHSEFQSSLTETHFSVITDYGRTYSIELVELARRFFLQQFSRLTIEEKDRLKSIATAIDKYADEREKIEREYREDRVAEAFRSEFAKAAKVQADRGNVTEAIGMYELAIEDDPLNSALHDRFSWFLLNKGRDPERAKILSERAVELDQNNCDALVGLALANYRLGDIPNGDSNIDKAGRKGRPPSFCYLRKAIARYHKSSEEIDLNAQIALLEEAENLLTQAQKLASKSDAYNTKTQREIIRYQSLTKTKLSVLRGKRTKAANAV